MGDTPKVPRFSLADTLKSRRESIHAEFEEQRKLLMKVKAIAKLSEDLGIDMAAVREFADTGVSALTNLEEQLDRAIETRVEKK